MAMEEELSFLRQKVNRLEDMMYNLNSKIGDILEKFLNHRAGQLAGICKVLQGDEDVCLSLVTQLQSCISNGSQYGMHQEQGHVSQCSGRPTSSTALRPTSGQRQQPKRVTRSSTSAATARVNETNMSEIAGDTFDGIHHTQALDDLSNSVGVDQEFTVTVKVEPLDENLLPETSEQVEDSEMLMQTTFTFEHTDEESESESDPGRESDPDFQFYQSMMKKKERLKQRRGRKFVKKDPKFNRSFNSLVEARAQIRAEEQWATKAKSTAQNGQWQKYYCKCKADYNCPVTMELWVDQESGTVSEYICGEPSEHVHKKKKNPQGLPKNVREVVDNIFFGGVTEFDAIYTELAKKVPDQTIPRRKARYYVERLREKKYGSLSFLKESKSKEAGNGAGSKSKSKSPKKRKRQEISNATDENEGENEGGAHQQFPQELGQGITTA